MQLTKEQIEEMEREVKTCDKLAARVLFTPQEAAELLRGYRAYLAEVEFHEQTYTQVIKGLTSKELDGEDKGYWEALAFRSTKRYSVLLGITIDEAHSRLSSLKKVSE